MPCSSVVRRRPWFGVGVVVLQAALWSGHAAAVEPVPSPEPAVAPPLYIGEPAAGGSLAGIPNAVGVDMLPDWPRWFAGASGLVMTRTLGSGAATMQPLGATQLSTSDATPSWPGGVDLHLGRWFGPHQRHAVEFIYWGVYGLGTTATVAAGSPSIEAIPQAPGVTIGGTPAAGFLVAARGQQISRADVVNDVEINWLYSLWERPEFLPRERRVSLMWLAGFRYFGLSDQLYLTTTPGNAALPPSRLTVATNNNLYGAQVGAKFDWLFLPGLRLDIVPKFMIGGNSVTNTTSLATTTGTPAVFASGAPVSVHQTLGVFSWLGSVDTGLAWDVTEHWTLSIGYRVVGVGNVAQADGQWPALIATPASLPGLSAASSTIIHGGFAGFEARY